MYVITVFCLSYAVTNVGLPRQLVLGSIALGAAVELLTIPAFGALSDRIVLRAVLSAADTGVDRYSTVSTPPMNNIDQNSFTRRAALGLAACTPASSADASNSSDSSLVLQHCPSGDTFAMSAEDGSPMMRNIHQRRSC
jgi:hypothetical protein